MTPILDGSDDGTGMEDLNNPRSFASMDFDGVDDRGPEEKVFPTEWHVIDSIAGIECRQTSEETYQLRSSSHIITVNQEGFDLYRDNSDAGRAIFEDWCARFAIIAVPRTDVTQNSEVPHDQP